MLHFVQRLTVVCSSDRTMAKNIRDFCMSKPVSIVRIIVSIAGSKLTRRLRNLAAAAGEPASSQVQIGRVKQMKKADPTRGSAFFVLTIMEARVGIEPAYTELQSAA